MIASGRAFAFLFVIGSLSAFGAAGCGSDSPAPSESSVKDPTASSFASLPTKRCITSQGIERPSVPLDDLTVVPVSSDGLEDFAAFTNSTGTVLIGPAQWKCESTVAVDGGETIGVTPDGQDPFKDGAELGITYDVSTACQGCIAAEICAILPDAPVVLEYADMGVGCDRTKPLKEKLTRIGDLSVLFEDPPGVKGQGTPSGGSVPSVGMLTYSEDRGSQQVSCAVPDTYSNACPAVVSGSMLHSFAHLDQGS